MSQTAEYYLRNLSRSEVSDLAQRIARQERRASEKQLQEMLRREAQELDGRLAGLQERMEGEQEVVRARLEQNRREAVKLEMRLRDEVQGVRQEMRHGQAELSEQINRNRAEARELESRLGALHRDVAHRHAYLLEQLEANRCAARELEGRLKGDIQGVRHDMERGQEELRQQVQRARYDTGKLEGRLLSEVGGLRSEVIHRNEHLQQQIDCNRRLAEAIRAQTTDQGAQLEKQEQALRTLEEQDQELQRQLEENGRFANELAERQAEAERRLNGKVEGLRDEVCIRHQQIQQQLDCNRRLAEMLRQHALIQDERLDEFGKALNILEEHDRELNEQLHESGRLMEQLAARQEEIQQRLASEIAERQAEREKLAMSLDHQVRLASGIIRSLNTGRLSAVGLQADTRGLVASFDRGLSAAKEPGKEQAALALLTDIQNEADKLLLRCEEREIEIGRRREAARLALEASTLRLARLNEDEAVRKLFAKPLAVVCERIEAVQSQCQQAEQSGGEFSRQLARWDSLVEDARALHGQMEHLWREKDEVIDRVRGRNRIVQAILESLMEVWGTDIEIDHLYAVADDPRSTLMLQTKRPLGRNATVHLDLDGRMQVSFTGYIGMECAKDVAAFQEKLERSAGLKVEQTALRDDPGKPNPPGLDGGGLPPLYRPASDNARSKGKEAARS